MSPKGDYHTFAESILVICKYLKILIMLSFTLPQRKVSSSEHLAHSDDSLHALNTVVTQGGKVECSCKKQACMLSCFSRVQLFVTPWTVAGGSSVHGIIQARILVWVAISSSKGSSQPRDRACIFCPALTGGFFTTSTTWEPKKQASPLKGNQQHLESDTI